MSCLTFNRPRMYLHLAATFPHGLYLQMQVSLLEQSEIENIIRRTAESVAAELRDDIEHARTPELMTKDQLAGYWQCSISHVNRQMKSGLPVEYVGESPRFRKTHIDAWLRSNRETKRTPLKIVRAG